ncbi:TlpA family protein disulfide reductase [Luteibacter jiangsuensis]|uniref:TlpA family protein disulfide reductase n=1 Tax=Luteibacter jiangsuensis TaxID=637577 RepID=A0ABX0Q428_9GAMM|nr:TlpA family protein disulfide reductase [Luteibacter jiangsuensis]
MLSIFLAGLWLGSSATTVPAAASTTESAPPSLLEQLAIPSDYRVSFEDQTGRPLSYAQFKAAMATRPFGVEKDRMTHKAILKLESDADIAKAHAEQTQPKSLAIQGHPFPAFSAQTLDGKKIDLASLRGKPFVANFFFAQCAPCIAETPVLSAFHKAHPDIAVVAFTFDDAATAREFARARHFNWPVLPDQQSVAEQAGIKIYPTMMLVDGDGIVAKATVSDAIHAAGKPLSVADLERWVKDTR